MKKAILIIMVFNLLIQLSCSAQNTLKKESIKAEELSTWQTLDTGKSTVKGEELLIEETAGADGYFIISPKSYKGDIRINYKVKALSESSVCIVLLFSSDEGDSEQLTLPSADAKGRDFWDWRTKLEHYNLTFNNASHKTKPFFFKNLSPFKRGFYQNRADNIMSTQEWNDVEIGRKGTRMWFKLNDTLIFEQEDCNPLSGGHVIFRISGTTGENTILAKIALKDLVISHQ